MTEATIKQVELQDGASADIVQENVQHLKELFPDAFTENGVNFNTLRQLLGDLKVLDEGEEKYGLNWHGKKQARQIALTPSLGTLLPCPEESVDWDTTQNLFIEGDNLEVLKLLQKSYANKVKMIYIDPPYNTGKEFVYPDKFQDNLDTYLKYTGQIDDEGLKFASNTETGGRKHTNWLNMMYPRLKLAKHLLSNDGVIFISIDDNEYANLKEICDEVFGEENFISNFLWKKKGTTSNVKDAQVSSQVDYQLCYGKSEASRIKQRVKSTEDRSYPNQDDEGSYRTAVIEKKDSGAYKRDTMKFEILGHKPRDGKRWQIGESTARELESKNRFIWDGEKILLKIYEFEDSESYSAQPNLLDSHGTSDGGAKLANNELFNIPELFDNPKPIELLKHLISITTGNNDIVMDFFAGSSSTAHAVYDYNFTNKTSLKHIAIQLPEKVEEKTEAYKAGYKTIAEISKERIRRAAKKIKDENPDYDGDLGFKVFKLASSNIKAWNPDRTDLEGSLLDHKEHLVEGRSEQDILYELLLKRGVDLTTPIETREIAGKNVYSIGFGKIITCLDDLIAGDDVEPLAAGIVEWQKELKDTLGVKVLETHVFFKDSAFRDDVAKTNMAAILSQNGIDHVRSL